ncbi:MAG: helix-turn-helix transcriptional regulator [Rhodospirillaceae bacterium]|jgi:transcriptional regulator with XRE-family HTH domain|nr:helix-turn-helix transcriptional regulator [Rhodospirillaceae bacterium]
MAKKSQSDQFQDPHKAESDKDNSLEVAIGREVKRFRANLDMTVVELAKLADLSAGMLSKIETGQTSPSLATIKKVAEALNVPVTSLFRQFEENRDASYVPAGQGIQIERRGTRAGHQYRLLGHTVGGPVMAEPYLITLTDDSDVFPVFQHEGIEFIHVLEGEVDYRHGDKVYRLAPGDSLFFDADVMHGPEGLVSPPIKFLSIICYPGAQ